MIRRDETKSFSPEQYRGRLRFVLGTLVLIATGLVARAVDLQVLDEGFLEGQGDARYTRIAKLTANRGGIYDRNGEPLAASMPVDTVWANPPEVMKAADQIPSLAEALNRDKRWLTQLITSNLDREFVYLVRHMRPSDAAKVKELKIPGVYLQREYQRFYPAGEVTGHLLGFTKKYDDIGQEGLELAYDRWLGAEAGAKRVIQDRLGRTVEDVESIRPAHPGGDLITSIDLRIQYLAYRELKAAVQEYGAKAGTVIVLDIETGEVLAMVNQPAYNPNDRDQVAASRYRNRAATDIFEPGSSIKPFIAAAGVASGRYHGNTIIDTSPGFVQVGIKRIPDKHNLGPITLATVLAKSSNVGMTKMAMSLPPKSMYDTLTAFGFGEVTGSGFPGESAGLLNEYSHWRKIGQATISYGYGLSVTPLQLVRAYATLGAYGVKRPVTLRKVEEPVPGEQVIDPRTAKELLEMMESVVSMEGTGKRASLIGYRVAGKTGTAWTADAGAYSSDRYKSSFGGVVPASHPRLAALVVIDEPTGDRKNGGDVAAPVFANVMAGALRLMGVPPDGLDRVPATTLVQANP
ncbi:peptidoglycan D,D-transpeptidase FtsI family protein [Steroidobacter agaridevorans]|uniref:peptidoglycan D,D-transpeptidase FtsI family protein n=1 Tax=Steroidobacter agaridevorans TaxID=2695856 RepID=UPI0013219920|nr:penicillin-binding transpeptidase domain-containing protein [Steroidobacter agaridevorans]GFE88734.1 penicillin-binding protein 3 [Steroidobacter agaridevorans]